MTKQEFDESRCDAVVSLHHGGNAEQDHLIDEVRHPETEEALEAMAVLHAPTDSRTTVSW